MRALLSALLAAIVLDAGVAAQKVKTEKVQGYAEWQEAGDVVVDGQRVTANQSTKFRNRAFASLPAIPLGYEVEAEGARLGDGRLLAAWVDARPNGTAMFEKEVRSATDQVEAKWLASGAVYEEDEKGRHVIGKTLDSGPDVVRARRILDRLMPPYVNRNAVRLHVVQTKDWNAMAMGNGAVWIFTGLMHDMDDDEVAIVVAHELAHYTHEHTRRSFKRGMYLQLALIGVSVAAETVDDNTTKAVVALAGTFSLMAVKNGYGRDLEDQADRVGLRYAYEAGYDVARGPTLWKRFVDKYGDQNRLVNFFLGDHSTSSARIRNLNREIALNYRVRAPSAP